MLVYENSATGRVLSTKVQQFFTNLKHWNDGTINEALPSQECSTADHFRNNLLFDVVEAACVFQFAPLRFVFGLLR